MSRKFRLIDTALPTPSRQPLVTNWKLCVICKEDNEELLTCLKKRKDVGRGYSSLADNLIKFNQLGELPFKLERLDDGNYGIEVTMVKNNAQYHQLCQLKYNN